MTWSLDKQFSNTTDQIENLAAKDYLLINGVWKTDNNGNRILPFNGRLPDITAIDVDALKGAATSAHEKFPTCDALVFPANDAPPCLIEFKDQNERNVKQPEIMGKCWGSLVVLHKTLLKAHDFKDVAREIRLIIVFSSSKGKLSQFMAGKAGAVRDSFGCPICWDLDYYTQVGLFAAVHTWDDSQFTAHRNSLGI